VELAVAKYWGAARAHFEAYDTTHPVLNIEVKCREKPPSVKLEQWLQQAEASCSDRLPMVQYHIVGTPHDDDVVITRAKSFRELLITEGVIGDPR